MTQDREVDVMGVRRTDNAQWSLAMHSDDSNMCSLVNLGTRPAFEVTVELLEGADARKCGTVVFERIDPGSAVNVYRYSADLDVPPWDRVTVTWREDGGRFASRRLHHWDSESESTSSRQEQ